VDTSVYIILDSTGVEFGHYLLRLDQRNAPDNPGRRFSWHRYVRFVTTLQDLLLNLSWSVYAPISLLSLFIVLPLAPFVHKVHPSLTVVALFIFIVSTTYAWLAPPFTPNARIKVFFTQKVDLTNVTSAVSGPQLTRAITQLNVIEGYGARLTATLPSSWSSIDDSEGGQCIANKLRRGLTTCEWPVPPALLPSIASAKDGDKGTWLVANVTRL